MHFSLEIIDSEGRRRGERRPPGDLPAGDMKSLILEYGGYKTSPTSGNAFARSALEKIMPIPERDWLTYADCPLLFLSPFFGCVAAINSTLGEYRVHADNASGLIRNKAVQMKAIRHEIIRDMRQDAMLKTFCDCHDIEFSVGTVLRNWYSVKLRMISRRLDPAAHPIASESCLHLLEMGLMTLWGNSKLRTGRRLLFSGWLVAMAIGPRGLAQRLARSAYSRRNSGGFG
jgi:hypothetical protein